MSKKKNTSTTFNQFEKKCKCVICGRPATRSHVFLHPIDPQVYWSCDVCWATCLAEVHEGRRGSLIHRAINASGTKGNDLMQRLVAIVEDWLGRERQRADVIREAKTTWPASEKEEAFKLKEVALSTPVVAAIVERPMDSEGGQDKRGAECFICGEINSNLRDPICLYWADSAVVICSRCDQRYFSRHLVGAKLEHLMNCIRIANDYGVARTYAIEAALGTCSLEDAILKSRLPEPANTIGCGE